MGLLSWPQLANLTHSQVMPMSAAAIPTRGQRTHSGANPANRTASTNQVTDQARAA